MSMEGVRPPIGLLVGLMLLFAAACSGADTEGSIEPAPHSPPASAGPERAEFEAIAARAEGPKRERALAALATCVGGVCLARALTDEDAVAELLASCRKAAFAQLRGTRYDDKAPRAA